MQGRSNTSDDSDDEDEIVDPDEFGATVFITSVIVSNANFLKNQSSGSYVYGMTKSLGFISCIIFNSLTD